MKRCSRCGRSLSRDNFYVNRAGADGLTPDCKECRKKANAARRAALRRADPAALAGWGTKHPRRIATASGVSVEEVREREARGLYFCSACRRWKPGHAFGRDGRPSSVTGVLRICSSCCALAKSRAKARREREADARMGQLYFEGLGPAPAQSADAAGIGETEAAGASSGGGPAAGAGDAGGQGLLFESDGGPELDGDGADA